MFLNKKLTINLSFLYFGIEELLKYNINILFYFIWFIINNYYYP